MNQYPSYSLDQYDSCGPRPPVPGKECSRKEMTEFNDNARNWAESLTALLDDKEGRQVLLEFARSEGELHASRLRFYYACDGLKEHTDPNTIRALVFKIYKQWRKQSICEIPEEVHRIVREVKMNGLTPSVHIFDKMQSQVLKIIDETVYRTFTQSDMYFAHLNRDVHYLSSNNTSSSGSAEHTNYLSRSSTLPTLDEDAETVHFESSNFSSYSGGYHESAGACGGGPPMSLTRDALMATQHRRLEMGPTRSQSYSVYNQNLHTSYNPVSCRDSELQSVSSGHRTDSDTMSLSNVSMDGPTYRKQQSSMDRRVLKENSREIQNINTDNFPFQMIPRTKRIDPKSQTMSTQEFHKALIFKLEEIKKDREQKETLERKIREADPKNVSQAIMERLRMDDTNDQDILDQHVSRVWNDLTPGRSPGGMSPCSTNFRRQLVELPPQFASSSQNMRHSKSMPEPTKKLSNKWPSINTDSGISLMSSDTIGKYRDQGGDSRLYMRQDFTAIPGSSSGGSLPEPKLRLQEDDTRRSKRLPPPPPPQYQQPLPPLPAKPQQIGSLQRSPMESYTVVVFSFCDETLPYRIKIPGSSPPTLKQFKDLLPKKGNYRFFFKTLCDDLDSPIIQEEFRSDTDILPLFEGKVTGTVIINLNEKSN